MQPQRLTLKVLLTNVTLSKGQASVDQATSDINNSDPIVNAAAADGAATATNVALVYTCLSVFYSSLLFHGLQQRYQMLREFRMPASQR